MHEDFVSSRQEDTPWGARSRDKKGEEEEEEDGSPSSGAMNHGLFGIKGILN